jgi:hypothetical protein
VLGVDVVGCEIWWAGDVKILEFESWILEFVFSSFRYELGFSPCYLRFTEYRFEEKESD